MIPVFADTFYFLALFNTNDIAHSAAVQFAKTDGRQLVTTDWVLIEVADACAHPSKREYFLDLIAMLVRSPDALVVGATHELFGRGVALFAERMDKQWSLTDCLSFLVMQDQGIKEALTGDHHFEQAGFKTLLNV